MVSCAEVTTSTSLVCTGWITRSTTRARACDVFLLIKGWLDKQSPAMTHCGNPKERGLLDGKSTCKIKQARIVWLGTRCYTASAEQGLGLWGSSSLCGKGADHARQPNFLQTLKHNIGINLCQAPRYTQDACLFLASRE